MTLFTRQRGAITCAAAALGLAVAAPGFAMQPAAPGGYEAAATAYKAVEARDYPGAARAAAEAVRLEPDNRAYRLLLFDTLTSAGQPGPALTALEPLKGDEAYDVQSRLAVAYATARPQDAARASALAARKAPTPETRAFMSRSRILALLQLGQKPQARAAFDQGMGDGALAASQPIDLAMIAVAVGDDATAQAQFNRARDAGALTGQTPLDAAYSAKRVGDDKVATGFFSTGLDNAKAGEFVLEPQAAYEIRRDVASLTRQWGTYGYLGYGASGNSAAGIAPTSGRGVTQAGVETYYRPGGYQQGRPVEVFARVFETVSADQPGPTGSDTAQGWVGIRRKIFADQNLVLEGSRMIKLGTAARNDWMARASYSAGQGQDLRADRTSWPMWSVYLDGARILESEETLGSFDARLGHSFTSLSSDGRTVLTPFVGLAGAYDSGLAPKETIGAGPGLSMRRWFRETAYQAPMSFIDLSIQYRVRLGGDREGKGLFATLSISY